MTKYLALSLSSGAQIADIHTYLHTHPRTHAYTHTHTRICTILRYKLHTWLSKSDERDDADAALVRR